MVRRIFILIVLAHCFTLFSQPGNDILWKTGMEKLRKLDYIKGVEIFDAYIQKHPNDKYAYYNRGLAKVFLSDLNGAGRDLAKAKGLGMEIPPVYQYLCDDSYRLKTLQKTYYKGETLTKDNNYRPEYTLRDSLKGALRPERTCFDVSFYNLSLRLNPQKKTISGHNSIYFSVLESSSKIQLDLDENLVIDKVVWNTIELNYTRRYGAVFIDFPNTLNIGSQHVVTVHYSGKPIVSNNPPWEGGFVWDKNGLFERFAGVSCEYAGSSIWWPGKDHLSDRPDSMAINIEAPDKYQVVCNGTLRNIIALSDNYNRHEWFVGSAINNYSATFYMAKYSQFTDTLLSIGDTLLCHYHVSPKNLEKAKQHFQQAKEILDFYNRTFGAFPFWEDGFRMVESPYPGMEHQTAIAYGNAYDNTKHAYFFDNKIYDHIIVHDAAHEWWGNSVTATDMADAWIHETFATYSELLFHEEHLGYFETQKELQNQMHAISNFWPMVQNRNVNEYSHASGDIYLKGATMLNCLRSTIANDTLFYGWLKALYTRFRNSVVQTQDIIDFTSGYFNRDLSPLFKKYLYETDLPTLYYAYRYTDEGVYFTYRWENVENGFEMPFALRYNNNQSIRLVGTTENQEFLLKNTETFGFYNTFSSLEGVPKFGFTYFTTHCEKYTLHAADPHFDKLF